MDILVIDDAIPINIGETMRADNPFFAVTLVGVTFLWLASLVQARIPEPNHILYGVFPDEQNVISAQINGEVIKSYSRGDVSIAGDFFILRLPIDSLDPQEPGTARPGDAVSLFLEAETEATIVLTVGARGTAQRVVLPTANDDNDSFLNNADNCFDRANDDQGDADNDGQGDACDDNSDTDRDGYTDMQEYIYALNGILDPDDKVFDPLVKNASGGTGYTDAQSMLINAIEILQILTGSDSDCSDCTIDIGNDHIIGMAEVINYLRSAADL